MLRLSTLLLLTCGVIFIQATPFSNKNTNVNTNVNSYRRNYNANANTNLVNAAGGSSRHPYNDDDDDEDNDDDDDAAKAGDPQVSLKKIRDKLNADGDEKASEVVMTVADSTLRIIKSFADEMSESASVAVADALANILSNYRGHETHCGRRNGNYNSNVNTNIVGRSSTAKKIDERDVIYDKEDDHFSTAALLELENSLDSILGHIGESSDSKIPKMRTGYYPSESMSRRADPVAVDDPSDSVEQSLENTPAVIVDHDSETEELENSTSNDTIVPKKPLVEEAKMHAEHVDNRIWDRVNRRNAKRLRGNGNRRGTNSKALRRNNVNSNSNFNSYRRNNVNSNSNSNRINRGHHYH